MTARPREGVEASLIPCCRTASILVGDWGCGEESCHLESSPATSSLPSVASSCWPP